MLAVEGQGLVTTGEEHDLVIVAAHAEVGEVMQERTEGALAVGRVGLRVENVRVPHGVDGMRWHQRLLRVVAREREKSPVFLDGQAAKGRGPAEPVSLALVRIEELVLHHRQVDLVKAVVEKQAVHLLILSARKGSVYLWHAQRQERTHR